MSFMKLWGKAIVKTLAWIAGVAAFCGFIWLCFMGIEALLTGSLSLFGFVGTASIAAVLFVLGWAAMLAHDEQERLSRKTREEEWEASDEQQRAYRREQHERLMYQREQERIDRESNI